MKCKRSGRGAGGAGGLDGYEEAANQEHAQVDGEHDRADAGRHRARNPCAEWRGNGSHQANNQRGLHMHQLALQVCHARGDRVRKHGQQRRASRNQIGTLRKSIAIRVPAIAKAASCQSARLRTCRKTAAARRASPRFRKSRTK